MADTIGEKELSKKYPVEEGIIAGTTKEKSEPHSLKPSEEKLTGQGWGCVK